MNTNQTNHTNHAKRSHAQTRPAASHPSPRAFTLIELLVVVSIIALLVSILMPALGKAREQARFVVCKSNVRQIGLGVQSYAADNRDFVPPINYNWPENQVYTGSLDVLWEHGQSRGLGLLTPTYIPDLLFFACPNDRAMVERLKSQERIDQPSPYANTATSYIYAGGLNSTHPMVNVGSRRKTTDLPSRGLLAFDRFYYDPDGSRHYLHKNQRLNALMLSSEVADVMVPESVSIFYTVDLARYVEDQLSKTY